MRAVETSGSNLQRLKHLCLKAINDFEIDLTGACVLTEAASGPFVVTPLLAALAGAQVDAVTNDSKYGRCEEVSSLVMGLADAWQVSERINIHTRLTPQIIKRADVVTNLGFVRPIDYHFINQMKSSSVIPLMWEPWEFRPEDLDLKACRERGIPVIGTNESDPRINTYDFVGLLPVKILLNHGMEVCGNNVALVGSGIFFEKAREMLAATGANLSLFKINEQSENFLIPDNTEAVIFMEHQYSRPLTGKEGMVLNAPLFWKGKKVFHLCGNVDTIGLKDAGAELVPDDPVPFGRMSFTTAYLGPLPVVRLHAAGLKVGEAMWRARLANKSGTEFDLHVLKASPAMLFE